jgi:two-component system, OmpR family, alkaline phosphatase synthesis response regulator PhoP
VTAPAAEPTTDRAHVLVVDDEPHVGRIIQMKLEQGPFKVTLAFDGIQALEALDREVDLKVVWLDLMMPHVSGLEVLARMRANERTKEIPCVILTAAGHDTQRDKAMTLGATDFMTKPFSPKRLLHRTAELAGVDYESAPNVNYDPDPRD